MLQVEELGLFRADLGRSVNLFVGAGFSTLAKNGLNKNLPAGDELRLLLIDHFDLSEYKNLDLSGVYAVLLADRREALRKYLESIFIVKSCSSEYDSLRLLDVEYLYTTNIDDLPFHIFESRPGDSGKVLHDIYQYGAPRHPRDVVQYIPLHGSVRHDDGDFLFTAGQLSSAFASDRETWYVFQRELQARPTLFVGYGMRDAGVLQALHDSGAASKNNRWILLRSDDAGARALYKSLGFHVIVGETADLLSYIASEHAVVANSFSAPRAVHAGQVPSVAGIAQRPIRSFFIGAEPEWSDAYSSQVHRRRINSAVKNSLYSGKHVAVVGLPLSGKTTILKQVAAEISADRPVIYFDRITEPQAAQIISDHAEVDYKPLVFVDNLIDSREAIDKLVGAGGAQIIGAEQSLYFDSANIKSLSGKLDVHSSSELSGQDLQSIIDSIPVEVRRWNPDELDLIESDAGEVGLFESFRRHVFNENLTTRFRAKLAEFEARDPEAFDVYLMACYVAACRTIVSFDMVYMYIDRQNKDYSYVYEIIGRINSFLVEVDMADDQHQDYFSVRSGALAKIALRECQPRSFGRVYDRFHAAVPERVVVDYPVFRRYAYDNDFARRAYPRVADGKRFYERLVKSTDNAYDYQHGAIYLSKMKGFSDAFSWIDTALSKSRGRVYSIRNTHARILFEANIDVLTNDVHNVTALEGVRESMGVLQTCIEKDQRRSYHLLRFSDQALQYAAIIDDSDAIGWLAHARERLREMVDQATVSKSRESYNLRKYRNLYNDVRNALSVRGH